VQARDESLPHAAALAPQPLKSYPDGQPFEVLLDGSTLVTRPLQRGERSRWTLKHSPQALALEWAGPRDTHPPVADTLAALEAAFSLHPQHRELVLAMPGAHAAELVRPGIVRPAGPGRSSVAREQLWQQARLWMPPGGGTPYALQYTLTQGRRHPRRAPKPSGVLYQRHIPWVGKTFSFRALELEQDLPRFHRWMNDPAVVHFWQEAGDLAKHRAYLEAIIADPHMYSMIASFDDQPFAYFEVYWARENRLAPFYDVDDFDRGWHVAVGETDFRGRQFATAWLTSISHYLFLDDPRTQRAVGEPRADHERQIRNLDKSGYAKVKEFDFPHKRAMLVVLLRERYFGDGLWLPRGD
jgi:acetyl CoA:N6-hydroxylysine acetyl transferase